MIRKNDFLFRNFKFENLQNDIVLATLEKKHKSAVNSLALSSVGDGSVDPVLYSGACDWLVLVWEKNGEFRSGDGLDGGF
jgi:hypothetical protein